MSDQANSERLARSAGQAPAQKGFLQPTRTVVVRLPAVPFNIDQTLQIVREAIVDSSCTTCFSGVNWHFTYENEFIVNAAGQVQPEI